MRKMVIALAIIVLAVAALYALGPRVSTDHSIDFDASAIGPDPEAYLAAEEARVANIRPDLAKEIVWADPSKRARTPLSIVYIHGFSASKGEVRPLPDMLASELGANLYYTRLAGHGQDSAAMGGATLKAWMNDTAEALAIGRMIGERVIVLATSTGGSLATIAAFEPGQFENIAALVMLSPNFQVKAAGASLLTGPWGRQLAEMIVGPERGFEPSNDLVRELWTTRYPTVATLPMAAAVKIAGEIPVERLGVPTLFIISDRDEVVDAAATRRMAARWSKPADIIAVANSGDRSNHVNAGDPMSPATTKPIADDILQWLQQVHVTD